jgi:hypothetical protein
MNTVNNNYELYILTTAINNYLDLTLPSDAKKALYLILHQNDDFVWNIATSIYRTSGHKVDFSLVRDIANSRIESLKRLAIKQAEEEAKIKAEEEKRRIEEARQKAEQEIKRKAQKEALERTPIEIEKEKKLDG